MEGQGKRLLLAVALALGVMLVWNMIFPSTPPDEPAQAQGSGSGSGGFAMVAPSAKSRVCIAKPATGAPDEPAKLTLESPDEVISRTYPGKLDAKFSSNGGTLVSWRLNDPRYLKDYTKGELMAKQAGSFAVGFWAGSKKCLPEHQTWTLDKTKTNDTTVVYTYTYDGIELTKVFTIVPEAFVIRMSVTVKITNTGTEPITQNLTVTSYAFQDPDHLGGGGMQVSAREWGSSTLRDGELVHTTLKELQEKPEAIPEPRYEANIQWTGFEHPYLFAAYAPKRTVPTEMIAKHTYPIQPYGLMRTDIEHSPGDRFAVGTSTVTREVIAYLGPKNYYQLTDADAIAEKENWETHFSTTIDIG